MAWAGSPTWSNTVQVFLMHKLINHSSHEYDVRITRLMVSSISNKLVNADLDIRIQFSKYKFIYCVQQGFQTQMDRRAS